MVHLRHMSAFYGGLLLLSSFRRLVGSVNLVVYRYKGYDCDRSITSNSGDWGRGYQTGHLHRKKQIFDNMELTTHGRKDPTFHKLKFVGDLFSGFPRRLCRICTENLSQHNFTDMG